MPVALRVLVITGVGGTTVRVRVPVPVPPALVAVIVTLLVPVTDAVPEMIPLLESTLRPLGRPVALKLVGLFVATI